MKEYACCGLFGLILLAALFFAGRNDGNGKVIDSGYDADPSILVNRHNMEDDVDQYPSLLPRYIDVLDDGVITRGEGVRWEAEVEKLAAEKYVMEKISGITK